MKQEIIDSYRTAFEDLKGMFERIEEEVKNEATADVSGFMFENKFDESQAAVSYLKTLLTKIKVEIDFNDIEASIKDYNAKMDMLRNNQQMVREISNEPPTQQVTSKDVFKNNVQPSESNESFFDFVQSRLKNHKFNIVKVDNDNIELEKNKKHYYLTVVKEDFKKEDYLSVLEKMNEKKNIGFICESEENMKVAKEIANNWAKSSPDYKVKFLTINFTTKEKLQQVDGNIFEPLKY